MPLTYREALDFVVATGSRGMKGGLDRTLALLDAVGNPHHGLHGVLVAGTNGKGSVCAMVDSACRAAGLRSALLTKPHLTSYRERIVLDGELIAEETFAALIEELRPAVDAVEDRVGAPTQFEILTVLGAMAARAHGAEVVICEVGLGGRLDSTNVLDLGVAAVTNVALDHREILGDTVEEIAAEKAGIIKPGNHVVTATTGPALRIIRERACSAEAELVAVGDGLTLSATSHGAEGLDVEVRRGAEALAFHIPLPGMFQAGNAAVAAGVCLALRDGGLPIAAEAIQTGFAMVRWPGRLQWLPSHPPMILDGAHNPAAIDAMVPAVRELCGDRPLVMLFGAMADKDVDGMLAGLRSLGATPVFTQAATLRALSAVELARRWGPGSRAVASLPDAVTAARMLAGRDGVVLVCGSIYLLGDVLPFLPAENPQG